MRAYVSAAPTPRSTLPARSRATRLRALGWAVALEAALLAALLAANVPGAPERAALVLPLTLLQLPGWLVAAGIFFPFDVAGGSSNALFATIMGLANVPAVYAVIRVSDPGQARASGFAEMLSRPYPYAVPTLVLAALVPMYMLVAAVTPGRTLFVPELALDRAIPLQPGWVLVYLSQWVFSFLPVFVVRGVELRRRAVLAYLTIVIAAYVGFLLYPTLGPRPDRVVGAGFFAWVLSGVYGFDPPYNCFPSLHVAYSFLAALTCHRVHRELGLAALLWAALIGVSTLFTRQHYIVDVLAGMAVALAAYLIFLRGGPGTTVLEVERRHAPRRAAMLMGVYGVAVAALWVAYQVRAAG